MKKLSNAECKRFAYLYAVECGYNATKTAKRMYEESGIDLRKNSARQYGYELMKDNRTQQYLDEVEENRRAENEINRREIIYNLTEIMRQDNGTISDTVRINAMDKLCRLGGFYNDSALSQNMNLDVLIVE